MLDFRRVHKFTIGFAILKPIVTTAFRCFYKEITVKGRENIPTGQARILAPNHQNALMDALALHATVPGPISFLARADIFNNPVIARLLRLIKIMPVFRIRDGVQSLKNNTATFDASSTVLQDKSCLGILPEGNHGKYRRLRPLKKGIVRVAFQAAEESNYSIPIFLVPIGLDYTNYIHMQSELSVEFGKPLDISKYYEKYKANPQKTLLEVIAELEIKIKSLIVNIETEDYYDLVNELRFVYNPTLCNRMGIKSKKRVDRIEADKVFAIEMDKRIKEYSPLIAPLEKTYFEYSAFVKENKLRDWTIAAPVISFGQLSLKLLLAILLLPVFLYGAILNYIPYTLALRISKNIKDPQFLSSVRFGAGLIFYIIYEIVMTICFNMVSSIPWSGLIFAVTLPLIGIFALKYFIAIKKTQGQLRWKNITKHLPAISLKVKQQRQEIINYCNELTKEVIKA